MKNLIIAAICLLGVSCTHTVSSHYRATGIIKGMDLGACACCGGYIMEISGTDSSYRFFYFPAATGFDTTSFPISVEFNYTETGICGPNNFITIQSVTKIE